MRRLGWGAALAVLLAATGGALGDEPPSALSDVPEGHWAYQAVDELCARGLIEGYPAGRFEGARPATRYEMASLVVRAVRATAQALREQGERLQEALAHQATAPQAAKPAPPPAGAAPARVGPEDIARIEKLIAEFRSELVTMGVRVEDLEGEVGSLRAALQAMDLRVSGLETEARKHRISGYLQVRYSHDEASDPTSEFVLRRALFNLAGPVSEKTDYRLQLQLHSKLSGRGPGSKVQLGDAYLTRQVGRAALRVGQEAVPFGYELEVSPTRLLAGERALAMDQLFPKQRDIGVFFYLPSDGDCPRCALAVVNGSGQNASDENNHKDIVARVGLPVAGGSVAASLYDGKAGTGGSSTVKSRVGFGADLTLKGTNLRAEYLRGRNLGRPVEGWYGEISRRLRGTPGTAFVKYDVYDQDRDTPSDRFRRTELGYVHELDAATRLTLVYQWRRPEAGFELYDSTKGDTGFAQLQVVY